MKTVLNFLIAFVIISLVLLIVYKREVIKMEKPYNAPKVEVTGIVLSGLDAPYKSVKLSLVMEVSDQESAKLIKAEEDKIWAMVSEAFSGTKEVKSAVAKDELKIKIQNMLNNYYKKDVIKNVYFTEFIIYE